MERFCVPCEDVEETSDSNSESTESSKCGLREYKPKDCEREDYKSKKCVPKVCKPKECKPKDPKIIYLRGNPGKTGRRGLPGPLGPQGNIGPQGPPGRPGPNGPHGPHGLPGRRGPRGAPGPMGPRGFFGPHGPIGPRGQPGPLGGPIGPAGRAGPPGPLGPQGIVGVKGSKGKKGVKGVKGKPGPAGSQGPPGRGGPRGCKGGGGAPGPKGVDGSKGPNGVVNNNFNLYLLKFWTTSDIIGTITEDPIRTPFGDVGNIELTYTSSPGFENFLNPVTGVEVSKDTDNFQFFVYLDLDAAVEIFFGVFPGYKITGLDLETRDVVISSQDPVVEDGLFKVTFDFKDKPNFDAYLNRGVVFSLNIRWSQNVLLV